MADKVMLTAVVVVVIVDNNYDDDLNIILLDGTHRQNECISVFIVLSLANR